MKGELYINNLDAWDTWMVRLVDDSLDNLLLPTNLKPFIENKNRNEHGVRILTSDIKDDERTVQLMFAITCGSREEYLRRYKSFVSELKKADLIIAVAPLYEVYRLTLESFLSLSTGVGIIDGKLSVRFKEANPANRGTVFTQRVIATEDNRVLLTEEEKGFEV